MIDTLEDDVYCPKCKDEFQPRFTTCPDCQVELVAELAVEEHPEVVTVAQIHEGGMLPLITSVLEGSGLVYSIEGGQAMSIHPGVAVAGKGRSARVISRAADAEAMRELLTGLDDVEIIDP